MKRQKQTQQTNFLSNGKVYRPERHGLGIWNNPRVVFSVRIDSKLKSKATAYLKAKFGSTCRGIESILVALLQAEIVQQDLTVYRNPTTNINFERVLIERNIRTRRRLVVEEETETVMKEVRRRKEDVNLERVFSGVLDQWESLKASAKRYHLKKAREYSYLKSAQLLLSLVEC